jgi:hypothetical protein
MRAARVEAEATRQRLEVAEAAAMAAMAEAERSEDAHRRAREDEEFMYSTGLVPPPLSYLVSLEARDAAAAAASSSSSSSRWAESEQQAAHEPPNYSLFDVDVDEDLGGAASPSPRLDSDSPQPSVSQGDKRQRVDTDDDDADETESTAMQRRPPQPTPWQPAVQPTASAYPADRPRPLLLLPTIPTPPPASSTPFPPMSPTPPPTPDGAAVSALSLQPWHAAPPAHPPAAAALPAPAPAPAPAPVVAAAAPPRVNTHGRMSEKRFDARKCAYVYDVHFAGGMQAGSDLLDMERLVPAAAAAAASAAARDCDGIFSWDVKYNGSHVFWDGFERVLFSKTPWRARGPVAVPEWFKDMLPADVVIEAELTVPKAGAPTYQAGRGTFTEMDHMEANRIVNTTANANDADWRKVTLYAFDLPCELDVATVNYMTRRMRLKRVVDENKRPLSPLWLAWGGVLDTDGHSLKDAANEVLRTYAQVTKGYEGIIVRDMRARYEAGLERPKAMGKHKNWRYTVVQLTQAETPNPGGETGYKIKVRTSLGTEQTVERYSPVARLVRNNTGGLFVGKFIGWHGFVDAVSRTEPAPTSFPFLNLVAEYRNDGQNVYAINRRLVYSRLYSYKGVER